MNSHFYTLIQRFVILNPVRIFLPILIFLASCGEEPAEQPQVAFDKAKWQIKQEGQYPYRKQMVKDILNNYKWAGVSKDSVVKMLGKEDVIEEGNLTYVYERKPSLGGLATTVEAVVFVLLPDSTVQMARLNDAGWD